MSLNNEVIAGVMSFRAGDDYLSGTVKVEVTAAYKDGTAEIAFDDQNRRHYLRLDLLALARIVNVMHKEDVPE